MISRAVGLAAALGAVTPGAPEESLLASGITPIYYEDQQKRVRSDDRTTKILLARPVLLSTRSSRAFSHNQYTENTAARKKYASKIFDKTGMCKFLTATRPP
jgi:hypothetical protein